MFFKQLIKVSFVASFLSGCIFPSAPDACDFDPIGCKSSEGDFPTDLVCTKDTPLTVEIGQGYDSFEPVDLFNDLEIHSGPQGGSHSFISVRIGELELSRYGQVRLEIGLVQQQCMDEPENCNPRSRVVFLGIDEPLQIVNDTTIEALGYLIFMNEAARNPKYELKVVATDPCGRSAEAILGH